MENRILHEELPHSFVFHLSTTFRKINHKIKELQTPKKVGFLPQTDLHPLRKNAQDIHPHMKSNLGIRIRTFVATALSNVRRDGVI